VLDPHACRVGFQLDYDFESPRMTRIAGPMFDHIANTMVDACVARARQTCGCVSRPLQPAPTQETHGNDPV
jgi:ribosome-associated toxin RatA of RatAB toxin-antitoxin module